MVNEEIEKGTLVELSLAFDGSQPSEGVVFVIRH
jgi:hypothetical protein